MVQEATTMHFSTSRRQDTLSRSNLVPSLQMGQVKRWHNNFAFWKMLCVLNKCTIALFAYIYIYKLDNKSFNYFSDRSVYLNQFFNAVEIDWFVNLGCVHTKCDAATKTQYFPFIFSRTLYSTVALVVHTFSNNFHHKPVQRLKLNLTELFGCCSVHHTAAASRRSRQLDTNATTQLNYTTQSHTVNRAMLVTWDSLPHNHHTTLPGFNAAPDMICERSLISFIAPYSFLSLYLQMCIPMMRMTWYWTPSYQSTCLTLALTWWPWRRQALNSFENLFQPDTARLIHNSKLIISLAPLRTRFISGCTAIGRRQNCPCTQLHSLHTDL